MLGKTAGGLFWMFRHLERSENIARLIEAGFRIGLTSTAGEDDEWDSVLRTAAVSNLYHQKYETIDAGHAIDFLLRDPTNPSSVMSSIAAARQNARLVRTAITREVWETVNDTFMMLKQALARPVPARDLHEILGMVRQQSAQVRGAMHGTMLRNDVFDFCRVGTFLERADNTARILDVKYYVLLPSVSQIGSSLDNVQWDTILRSVAGERAYRWINHGETTPRGITDFLIFDRRMPRSLIFTVGKIDNNLSYLAGAYGAEMPCQTQVAELNHMLKTTSIETVFDDGLHEFLTDFLTRISCLGQQIEQDYRFLG